MKFPNTYNDYFSIFMAAMTGIVFKAFSQQIDAGRSIFTMNNNILPCNNASHLDVVLFPLRNAQNENGEKQITAPLVRRYGTCLLVIVNILPALKTTQSCKAVK